VEAVNARQKKIEEQHAPAIDAVREAHKRNRLRGAQRPRYLLSGLLFCGCCGGPLALRGQDRYACSNHVNSGTCTVIENSGYRPALLDRLDELELQRSRGSVPIVVGIW
jgi:hypothetical protein